MAGTIDWPGKSGKMYRYWFSDTIAPAASGLKKEGGNYIYVKQLTNDNWLPVYIGQADDLSGRLPNHDRLSDASRAGATHLMTHTTPGGEQVRLDEEKDLIARWNPVLNTHHTKVQ
jgi:hypothetical protein